MYSNLILLVIFCFISSTHCVNHKKSGEEIADELYKHPNACKDPNDGGIWAPLAAGQTCNGRNCNYPEEWCSARHSGSKSTPQLNCVKLPEDCKKAVKMADAANTTQKTSAAPKSTTTHPKITTTQPKPTTHAPKLKPTTTAEPEEESTTSATSSSEEDEDVQTVPPNRIPKGPPKDRKTEESLQAEAAASHAAAKSANDCKDGHPLCCFWASNLQPAGSECDRNALWMRTTCQKSCGTCGCKASNFASCKVNVNVDGCPYLQGSQSQFVFVPVNRAGGSPFSFPTVRGGGNQASVVVPVSGGGLAQNNFLRSGSSQISVPLRGPNLAGQNLNGGPAPVRVPLVG